VYAIDASTYNYISFISVVYIDPEQINSSAIYHTKLHLKHVNTHAWVSLNHFEGKTALFAALQECRWMANI